MKTPAIHPSRCKTCRRAYAPYPGAASHRLLDRILDAALSVAITMAIIVILLFVVIL